MNLLTSATTRNLGLGIALILIVIASLAIAGHGSVVDQGVNNTGRIVGAATDAPRRAVRHVKRHLVRRAAAVAAA